MIKQYPKVLLISRTFALAPSAALHGVKKENQ